MNLVTKIDNIPLSIYQITADSKWLSPDIISTNGKLVQVSLTAANQIASYAGLKDADSASRLFNQYPIKWKLFENVFSDYLESCLDIQGLFNADGTRLYSLIIDDLEETLDVFKFFEQVSLRGSSINQGDVQNENCIYSVEEYEDKVIQVTAFLPQSKKVISYAYALQAEDGRFYATQVYDSVLIGKKHKFIALDIEKGSFEFSLFDATELGYETNPNFRFSLKEMIEFLRIIQNTKMLPTTLESFQESIALNVGAVNLEIIQKAEDFYEKLHDYFFYYDNKKRTITDDSLIHDKLKTAKPHLYFHQDIQFSEIKSFLVELMTIELNHLLDLQDVFAYDFSYLFKISAYYHKLRNKNDDSFDFYKIPYFFIEDDTN
jgi:uncharacterized membrane protein